MRITTKTVSSRLLAGAVFLLGGMAHATRDGVPQGVAATVAPTQAGAAADAAPPAGAAPVPAGPAAVSEAAAVSLPPDPAVEVAVAPEEVPAGPPAHPLAGLTPGECAEVFDQAAGSYKRQKPGAGLPLYAEPETERKDDLVGPVCDTPTAAEARERRRRFDDLSREQQDAVCLQALATVQAWEGTGSRSRGSLAVIREWDGSAAPPAAGPTLEGGTAGAPEWDEVEQGSLETASEEIEPQLSPSDKADIGRARWHRMPADEQQRVLQDAAWLARNRKLVDLYLAQMNAPPARPPAPPKKSCFRKWCCWCCD